ncbi:MAG: hypothetical protein HRU02_03630 [Myxococcales bacterium]|nr:hypothetical protein [Myxococcales bacterium]
MKVLDPSSAWQVGLREGVRVAGWLGVLCCLIVAPGVLRAAQPGDLILNEFNAVTTGNFLGLGSGSDSFLGVVPGNGGNWVELVVVADHLDVRGWTLEWENADLDNNTGRLVFGQSLLWADLRAGTLITIREDDLGAPGFGALPTDLSFDPQAGDWWIHINADDVGHLFKLGFKVDNDGWAMRILDASSPANVVQDFVGENRPLWAGTAVSSSEVGKLKQNPSAAAAFAALQNYDDGDSSTFGSPNTWAGGALVQDLSTLRAQVLAPPAPVPGLLPGLLVLLAALLGFVAFRVLRV